MGSRGEVHVKLASVGPLSPADVLPRAVAVGVAWESGCVVDETTGSRVASAEGPVRTLQRVG